MIEKLTEEDKEGLLIARNSSEFKLFIKLLNILAEEQNRAIIQSDLRITSDRDLTILKARAEGASKLVRDALGVLQKQKSKS